MISIYDELSEKLAVNPGLTRRGGARADIGILLFSEREAIRSLWEAASRVTGLEGSASLNDLRSAVERLRPLFGER